MDYTIAEKILEINAQLIEVYGIPKKAEVAPAPLDLLIATILSQNTNDNNSYSAYLNLKNRFTNWEELLEVSIDEIKELIKVAGLTNQKANAIVSFLNYLYNKNGHVSLDFITTMSNNEIMELLTNQKGIGVKTAACVLLFSLERNVCPIDTHVHRLVNRLGIVSTKNPEESFYNINDNFPTENIAHQFHTNLILHGRNVCRPKNPFCKNCSFINRCIYEFKYPLSKSSPSNNNFLLLDNI